MADLRARLNIELINYCSVGKSLGSVRSIVSVILMVNLEGSVKFYIYNISPPPSRACC